MNYAIINPDTPDKIKKSISGAGFNILEIPLLESVDRPIAGHVDIQLFKSRSTVFLHKFLPKKILSILERYFTVNIINSLPKAPYPNDVILNILHNDKTAFHSISNTSKEVKEYFLKENIESINVNQGYSACSSIILDNTIISADPSILTAASGNNYTTIKISVGNIELPGYNYGFIGGCTGTFNNTIYFCGNLDKHPDKDKIAEAISLENKKYTCLSDEQLFDCGSIFFFGDNCE